MLQADMILAVEEVGVTWRTHNSVYSQGILPRISQLAEALHLVHFVMSALRRGVGEAV